MSLHALYANTVADFIQDTCVHSKMKKAQTNRHKISKANNASLKDSILATKRLCTSLIAKNPSAKDALILLEIKITNNNQSRDADVLFLGFNKLNRAAAFFLENKAWSNDFLIKTDEETMRKGYVLTRYHDSDDDDGKRKHPSFQASDYRWIPTFFDEFSGIEIKAAGFCFNVNSGDSIYKLLYNTCYNDYIKDCRVYTQASQGKLVNSLDAVIGKGDGEKVLKKFMDEK